MEVKKFRDKTIAGATAKVKKALGSDAMIISTKKLSGNNREDLFEISAVPEGFDSSKTGRDPLSEVKSELISIREMICLLNRSDGVLEKLMVHPGILNFYAKLVKNGVSDHYARLFLERAGAFNGYAGSADDIPRKAVSEISKAIKTKEPFEVKDKKRVIAALIGTTGVGKTTTLAKLAARLMFKARKKVGFISIDTYRIGAMEQLKTYANILGIPCFQAFKRKDLLFALKRLETRDVVLIDTAGQSQYDTARIEELRRIMPDNLAIDTHLLLSIATNEAEMDRAAVNFSPLKFQSYIFTKTDEAENFGAAINQIMKLNVPVSYITTGQNVPEDIERADKRKILNRLLKKD